jgi:hypothetical protein
MKTKQRTHREWFRPVSLGNRKTCPNCKAKLVPSIAGGLNSAREHEWLTAPARESIYSWGEYHNAKWHTVKHFCRQCWPELARDIVAHTAGCGCVVELVGKGCTLPQWLTLPLASECELHSEGNHA